MGHASTVHTTILVNTRHAGAHDTSTVRYYHMQRVRVEHTAAPSPPKLGGATSGPSDGEVRPEMGPSNGGRSPPP